MDMAPSKETSCERHLPATVGSEVDILAKLLQDLSVGPVAGADSEMDDVEGHMMVEDRENEVLGGTQWGWQAERLKTNQEHHRHLTALMWLGQHS